MRNYNVIYEAINDLKAALAGMLAPEIRETVLGRAQVRQIFVISKLGPICGSYVHGGQDRARRQGARAPRRRPSSARAPSARSSASRTTCARCSPGLECGIGVDGVNDVQPGDILEAFTTEEVARTL